MAVLEARAQSYAPETRFQTSKIDAALTGARDIFVAKERRKEKTVVAYELDQDRAVYRELAKHKGEAGYESARDSLNAYTRMQIETHIGERLHVGISKFNFSIRDGELMAADAEESMLSMMKRGRDYRRTHGKKVDFARESAEVYGFEETQNVLANPETPIGTMMLSISPQGDVDNGSIYKQNFYDVYQKTEKGVDAYRFTSGLTREDSQQKVRRFDLRYAHDAVSSDVQFLARPIRFDPETSPFKTPNEIHKYLHKEHEFMDHNEFKQTIEICTPMIMSLINSLCNNPDAFAEHERNERIVLNAVDEVVKSRRRGETTLVSPTGKGTELYVRPWVPTTDDIDRLVGKPIRKVDTGCGASGGGSSASSYSVAEAASGSSFSGAMEDEYGSLDFECPKGHQNTRPVHKLIPNCTICGTPVSCEVTAQDEVDLAA